MGGDEKLTTTWNRYFILCMLKLVHRGESYFTPHHIAVPRNIVAGWFRKKDLCRTADAQFLDTGTEGTGVELQNRCSSGWPLDSPTGLSENSQDMLTFYGSQIL
jgi:hypothetical protein